MKEVLEEVSLEAKVVAKVETRKAVENFDGILNEADAVIVARGDLGMSFGIEEVPALQESIVKKCREGSW